VTLRSVAPPSGRLVVEVDGGITVYPARFTGDRWRAVWYENGERLQCEAVSEERLAPKVAKVAERLAADAPNMQAPGSELIAYFLCPDRLPPDRQWSRKHAHTQARLCQRFAVPVIAHLACEDIKTAHMQAIVNAAPTPGEGHRVAALVSALVGAGISGGYLASPRLKDVHWQARGRPLPPPRAAVAGESVLFVDPAEIPSHADVAKLGLALAPARSGLYELMASLAAYSGLRWGEIAALTTTQVNPETRVITVDRKVVEIAGHLYLETPKNRKQRRTIYPRATPQGYPLADQVAARAAQARAEQESGTNPLGLMFPSPKGCYWRASNFSRRVLDGAYHAAGWRPAPAGSPAWTWHSLRHVFCTTALFTWGIDATDVSRLAGHANYRITLDLYVGATAGTLDRARTATN